MATLGFIRRVFCRRSLCALASPAVLALAAALWGAPPGFAASAEVQVIVKGENGEPRSDVEVVLTALDINERPLASSSPFTRKTNKKGVTLFPFLDYNAQGLGRYALSLNLEGESIREFRIQSRQTQSS